MGSEAFAEGEIMATILTDDELSNLVESWAKSTQLRVYKHLNNMGCTLLAIDTAIAKALKDEKFNG